MGKIQEKVANVNGPFGTCSKLSLYVNHSDSLVFASVLRCSESYRPTSADRCSQRNILHGRTWWTWEMSCVSSKSLNIYHQHFLPRLVILRRNSTFSTCMITWNFLISWNYQPFVVNTRRHKHACFFMEGFNLIMNKIKTLVRSFAC
jgi:hypothetical protein